MIATGPSVSAATLRERTGKTPALQIVSGFRKVVAVIKSYKFQALVKLDPAADGAARAKLGRAPIRMVLRAKNTETQRSQVFSALVSTDDDGPFRPGNPSVIATLRLAGDDVGDYLDIGGHFDLWLGEDVGEGVITQRLFI